MSTAEVKSTEQIRMEILIQNFPYILQRLFLFLLTIIIVTVIIVAQILHIPTICARMWAWLYPSKFARRMRCVCRCVSRYVSLLGALWGLCTLCSLPIVVGATLEQNGPELELFVLWIKASVKPYLPAASFVIGTFFTYGVLRLRPDSEGASFGVNENVHATDPAVELFGHKFTPGAFPSTSSPSMVDDLKDRLLTKDEEIASLRKNLEQEDEELVELLAQKDEEISKYQTALKERDEKISALQVANMRSNQRPDSTTAEWPCFMLPSPTEKIRVMRLEKQLDVALACKAELEQKVASCIKKADVLKKENCELQMLREEETKHGSRRLRRRAPPVDPQDCLLFKKLQTRINALEAQLLEADNAQESIAAQHDQRVQQLEAQLSDAAETRESITSQYGQQIRELETQLSRRDIQAANAQEVIAGQYDQRVRELEARLAQQDVDAANTRQAITAQYDQRVHELEGHLASMHQTNHTLENQLQHAQSALGDVTQQLDTRKQRLDFLESQCVKADELYAQYMKLMHLYNNLRRAQAEKQNVGERQDDINSLEKELHAARREITELSKSKEQLERTLKDPRKINPLWEIALEEKEKQIEKARSIIQTMQQDLDAIRATGGPSSSFLNAHEALRQERNGLREKYVKLESKFYAMEIKAANLQARERSLTEQLSRFKK